jgi:hypothetical protein
VGTLNGAILMRTASAGELNIVTKLFKYFVETRIVEQFATLIDHDVFVGNINNVTFSEP